MLTLQYACLSEIGRRSSHLQPEDGQKRPGATDWNISEECYHEQLKQLSIWGKSAETNKPATFRKMRINQTEASFLHITPGIARPVFQLPVKLFRLSRVLVCAPCPKQCCAGISRHPAWKTPIVCHWPMVEWLVNLLRHELVGQLRMLDHSSVVTAWHDFQQRGNISAFTTKNRIPQSSSQPPA